MKDPRQILDAFRTDVRSRNVYSDLLRQFDLEQPKKRRNRKKFQPLKNHNLTNSTAILSLCMITGLSAGMGTAFAEDEIAPEKPPLDQPPSEVKVDVKAPELKERTVERNPSGPPPELQAEKPAKTVPPKDDEPREKVNREAGPEAKQQESPKSERKEATQRETEKKQQPSKENIAREPQASHPRSKLEKPLEKAEPPVKEPLTEVQKNLHKPQEKLQAGAHISEPSKNVGEDKAVNTSRSGSAPPVVASSGSKTQAAGNESGNRPRTEPGGKLPETAGNDLDGVLAGSAAALLGTLYAVRRSRVEKP
ncbi:hypothetical protein ACFO25_04550 [Paenactinomyces guangxiensis]|uniref:Uncharacterized protein n=1 Tax=Paenactinomyces guangxiensis TaxID=1490290 RepID=A0A7W1WPQ8_9BACL|nr:hypothetical protein [Paenactinomyces guangxiensis]MBA4493648.1 hypothetical protein [Paenactinomyces guangxiensis]MBH8590935.1 hypothetical protein [Paenactinomyces guangxiensis]